MGSYTKDNLGYPLDPDMRKLEFHLCDLAAWWRGEPKKRDVIINEYHATLSKLYELGWDGVLDVECELPDEYMPQEVIFSSVDNH